MTVSVVDWFLIHETSGREMSESFPGRPAPGPLPGLRGLGLTEVARVTEESSDLLKSIVFWGQSLNERHSLTSQLDTGSLTQAVTLATAAVSRTGVSSSSGPQRRAAASPQTCRAASEDAVHIIAIRRNEETFPFKM
jgi:hypothetical protein